MAGLTRLPLPDVRVGHFVVMDAPWHQHPFVRSQFLVQSGRDLERLRQAGYASVQVDLERSRVPREAVRSLPGLFDTAAAPARETILCPKRRRSRNPTGW